MAVGLEDALGLDAVHLLAWPATSSSNADGIRVGDRAALVVSDESGGRVLVSLQSETHARQVAHVMTSLDGFPMDALPVTVADGSAETKRHAF